MVDRMLGNLLRDLGGRDPYALLGVPRMACAEDIERAHRDRRRKLHPDLATESNKAMAEEMTKLVGSAYALLSKSDLRAVYDALMEAQQATARHQSQRRRAASTSLRTEPAAEWIDWGDGQVGTAHIRLAGAPRLSSHLCSLFSFPQSQP